MKFDLVFDRLIMLTQYKLDTLILLLILVDMRVITTIEMTQMKLLWNFVPLPLPKSTLFSLVQL